MKKIKTDLCIIGAGPGGLSVAAAAVQLGVSVTLVERGKMGGDCLNYGCVPSKALLAAAKAAYLVGKSDRFGVHCGDLQVDFAKAMQHVQDVINTLADNDSVARFEGMGVKVIQAAGRFIDQRTLQAGDYEISGKFIIATGATAVIPDIEGLDKVPFHTNETIFNLTNRPDHLLVIGGGAIGCELAQAFAMLGVKVSLIEKGAILRHEEADLVAILREEMQNQGVKLYEHSHLHHIEGQHENIEMTITHDQQQQTIRGSHLLVATGRRPNIKQLNLNAAAVAHSDRGINVNKRLRTSNKRIYAIGDVIGGFQFTHLANYHAGIIIRNLLFKLRTKVDYHALSWVTYTYPELAHVGVTANKHHYRVVEWPFDGNDRAHTELKTIGKIKVITNKKGRILGVSILGHNAGELILPWVMAIQDKKTMRRFTNITIPYPTFSEISKAVANEYYKPLLFSKTTRRIVKFLQKLPG